MTRTERYHHFLMHGKEHNPNPKTELDYRTPFELLVAIVLSAQCTDRRVNQVTPALFAAFPTPELMAQASFERLFPYLKTISYPNSKTRYLLGIAQQLIRDWQGKVPEDAKALQQLPGVGRKSAHALLGTIYGWSVMPVDTHVFRVARRIGLVSKQCRTPLGVERSLVRHLPKKLLYKTHHWLVLHGRYICKARTPTCTTCPFQKICLHYQESM